MKRKQSVDFGAFLKRKREAANLTQMAVAKAMGYGTSQFISNWERGVSNPPIKDFKKLARILQISGAMILDIYMVDFLKWEKLEATKKFVGSK